MRKGIIDRFEGDFAVVEIEGQTEDILKSHLPADAKIGDTLVFNENKITLDKSDTEIRKKEIINLMDELFED
ncbi:DUF3006 domain-containing protein [Paenibacillus macquariensis]|uniref:Pyruvate kinase n=1 Tax=Paenibacillus macquariensis TaxID=948756 RepID=A0ABY1KDK2_9BACL|nr:DUF3006 domain-containing protein [Paenibacillus macquariensis]OAB27364.1 pyruvate kinase [Paenibacillus macquariensis subsp. macquariensis]SIR66215.1 Protein of unknown function [Paenibacillus macquariensis]